MIRKSILVLCTTAVAVFSLSSTLNAASDDVISEVMKEYHKAPKGTDPIAKKAAKGEAKKAEVSKLLRGYKSMAKAEPPKGEVDAWNKRMETLIAATEALKEEKEGSVEAFAKAGDCKACHSEHKPD